MKAHNYYFIVHKCGGMGWGPAKSNFTAMEVNHIRVKTPGLFNGRKSFSIHLDSIKENEYCFPLPGGKVISAYGARRGHSGTDIKTKANDTIRCAFDGIVRMAKHTLLMEM